MRRGAAVVVLAAARAGDERAVEPLAQIAPAAVLHEGDVARASSVIRHGPLGGRARLARLPRRLRGELEQAAGRPATSSRPRSSSAHALVASRTLLLNRVDSSASSGWITLKRAGAAPSSPTPASSASRTSDSTMRRWAASSAAQVGPPGALEGLVDRLALPEAEPERDHLGLHGVVRLSQGLAVADSHEVADRAPDQPEPIGDAVIGSDRVPARLGARLGRRDRPQLGEERPDGGHDVLGADALESGRRGGVEERVLGVRHGCGLASPPGWR